jgi:tetratricopeptide (TPR) repeat protein
MTMGDAPKKKAKTVATVMKPPKLVWWRAWFSRLSHRQAELLVIGVVILVMAIFAIVRVYQEHHSGEGAMSLDAVMKEVDKDRQAHDNKAAERALQNYIDTHGDDKESVGQAQRELATVYATAGDNKQAYASYQKAVDATDPSKVGFGDYMALGDTAAASGNKAQAIDYYKKAITAVNKQKPAGYQSYVRYLNNQITNLGGSS